jgi:hypothetical protein
MADELDRIPTHWPRPNVARTHCLDCKKPIRKSGNGWLHAPPGRGRRTRAWYPNVAVAAIQEWHDAQARMDAARLDRDDALAHMAQAGMTAGHIAEATGLPPQTIMFLAGQISINIRKEDQARDPRALMKRRARKKTSPIFK